MSMMILFIQLLLVIPLFCINEYFYKKKLSNIQKILIPVIYIIVISGLWIEIKSNIYLIVIFEVIFHDFYINNIANTNILINKKEYFVNAIISIILSVIVYDYYISKVTNILPQPSEFSSLLWFLVVIFVYSLLKDIFPKTEKNNKEKFINRKKEYVVVMYATFKNKYYNLINSKYSLINRLTYAILIYENYSHPTVYRKINNIKNHFINNKYGMMQNQIPNYDMNEEQKITFLINELIKIYDRIDKKAKEKTIIYNLLREKYQNSESIKDIIDIYNAISEFEKR